PFFHLVDLCRRRLGAEECLLVEKERVPRRARRMPVGEAESVEVVTGRLDLAAVDDLIAEAEEDVLDVAAHERRRMQSSARPKLRGPEQLGRERHVDRLGGETLFELGARKLRFPLGERGLYRLADGVERHAGLAVAHVAQCELERAAPADVASPDICKRSKRSRLGSGGEGLLLEVVGVHCGDLIQRFLLLSRARDYGGSRPGSCCGGDDALLARRRPGDEPGLPKGEHARDRHLPGYYPA